MRVALPWLGYACGDCAYCNTGWETLCEAQENMACGLAAEHVVHAGEEDPIAAIKRLGGASAAISTAVNPVAFEQALGSLRRGGTLVCVGLPAENDMQLPIFQTVLGGLTVRGSIVGTHHDLEQAFELHRRGLTTVFRSERPLDDVNEAIEQVLDGTAPSPRLVFTPASRSPAMGRDDRAALGV